MLAAARCAVAEHQDQHRQSITRDALRTRFGISGQAVSGLPRQVRARESELPARSHTRRMALTRPGLRERSGRGRSAAWRLVRRPQRA